MFLKAIRNVKIGMNLVLKRSLSVSNVETVKDLASKDGELRVFIVAGEVSGDIIASRFMSSLKKLSPFPVRFAGVGGLMMSKQGIKSLFPMEEISVMGVWELLSHLYNLRVKLKETVKSALSFRPHVVLTVDSKGFSFRFLKHLRARCGQLRRASPQHFHFVAPSFWAWRGGEARLKGLSSFVDHVFCILPFEAEICRLNGLAASFVGHPILEDVLELKDSKSIGEEWKVEGDGQKFKKTNGISSGSTVISVLPGSRLQEVTRMLSMFSSTMELLKGDFSDLTAIIHVAPNKQVEEYIREAALAWPVTVVLVPGGELNTKYNSFNASRVALCTSGTVAVEMQLARLPCVIAYRAHILTEWFIRFKAKISYISLPNIVLNSAIIPEALFEACTPLQLASLLRDLLNDESLRQKQIDAAERFFNALDPSNVVNKISNSEEPVFVECTPSMMAASVVLKSGRP